MSRVKSAVTRKKRHKKILKMAKGYRGARSRHYKAAKETVIRGMQFSYRDRKVKKRDFRKLWIIRINAAARLNGLSYSQFMHGIKKAEIEIDRKVLAELAVSDPEAFARIAEKAKEAIS
jgi:large subunit ribosomal protein L20